MKKIILGCLGLFILFLNGLYAQPNPTQGTIKKTGGFTLTVYAKPQTTVVSAADLNLVFAISMPGVSGPGPILVTPKLGVGASVTPQPVEIKGTRRVYPYIYQLTSVFAMVGGQDNAIADIKFPNTIGADVVAQLNDYTGTGTDWGYWYISHSGADQTPYDNMFYGTNAVNVNGGDSKVDINSPLPVKLISFSAEKSGDKSAQLTWSTASESNSSYYNVERSYDKITWKTAGQVKAGGNSQIVLNFNFLDNDVYDGKSSSQIAYYRLKMVDLDNSFEYSPIESVNFGKASDAIVTNHEFVVYPNPASEGIHVQWDAAQPDQPTSLEFYDVSGKLIYTEKVDDQTNQQYVDFTKTNIQTGLCLMRVMSGDKAIEYKQIVVGQNH